MNLRHHYDQVELALAEKKRLQGVADNINAKDDQLTGRGTKCLGYRISSPFFLVALLPLEPSLLELRGFHTRRLKRSYEE